TQSNYSAFVLKMTIGFIILFVFPGIFLHFTYYLHQNGWVIKEYSDYLEIYIKNNKLNLIRIDKNNISEINIYMAPTTINYNSTTGLPVENYNYAKITIPEMDVIITNLIYPDIKALVSKFPDIKLNYHKTIYADI
ncbi:MAG: hypothetical protein WBP45_07185, partial [Daejeonella sp.]